MKVSRILIAGIVGVAVVAGAAWVTIGRTSLVAAVPGLAQSLAWLGVATETPKTDAKGPARQAAMVSTEIASARDVPSVVEAVGTVQPMLSVAIRARVDSQMETVHVAEGARVKQGDLLFTLDNRALKAQLAQAEAQLAKDRAQLEQAQRDVARYEELIERNATTRVNLDNAMTAVKVLTAQVAADEASRQNLATQLTFTEIHAPAAGRLGTIQAKAGNIVRQADATPLVTINQIDPIFVQFALPQSVLGQLRQAMTGAVRVQASVGDRQLEGDVAFIENSVDAATGTISVKGRIPNPEELLWPGAFTRVQVTLGIDKGVVVVPSNAIQMGLKGPYVFVVKDGKAELRPVEVRRTAGGQSVLASGLRPGEAVVTEGHLGLSAGAPVVTRQKSPAPVTPLARS